MKLVFKGSKGYESVFENKITANDLKRIEEEILEEARKHFQSSDDEIRFHARLSYDGHNYSTGQILDSTNYKKRISDLIYSVSLSLFDLGITQRKLI